MIELDFSPSLLATTAAENAKIYQTSTFSQLTELTYTGQRWVWDAAFTGDSQYLLTGKNNSSP